MVNFGENIRKIREKEKSYTQKYMADCLGLTTKAYGNIENGVTDITFKRLNEIAEILECDIYQIINYDKSQLGVTNNFTFNKESRFDSNFHYQGSDKEALGKIEALYQQLLESEKEKVRLLEKILNSK